MEESVIEDNVVSSLPVREFCGKLPGYLDDFVVGVVHVQEEPTT